MSDERVAMSGDERDAARREREEGQAWLARQPFPEARTEIEYFLRKQLHPEQRDAPPIEGGVSFDNPPPEVRAARAAQQAAKAAERQGNEMDDFGNYTEQDDESAGQQTVEATDETTDGTEEFDPFTAAELEVYNQLSAEDQAAVEQLGQDDPERQQALLDELVAIAAGDPEARARAEAGVAEQRPPPGTPEHAHFRGRLTQAGWDQHLADLRAQGKNIDGTYRRDYDGPR